MNRKKKKLYYVTKIDSIKHDGKKLWGTLISIMGRGDASAPSYIESEGTFITKPSEIANYFNDYFTDKVGKLRQQMPKFNWEISYVATY